jgi:rubrerythrin
VADLVSGDADAWLAAADEELRQLIDDMLHTEKSHMAAAERLQRAHFWVGILATVLAAAAAASIVAELSKVAAGLLALGAAIASGVLTFMKPDRRAEQHLAAGRQLAALRVRARQVLNLDLQHLSWAECRKEIADVASEKGRIDQTASGITDRDFKVARNKITKGTFDRDR